ncbi:replication-relaxation family protein [Rhodococcus sp. 1139]|uniref:replication-relaxation family protein n=1 Tax=Rhodococcus sp. 1139 TaxID=1833762 RepID=UPI0009F1DA53|nr:replication-relaxation family protein [Rhodococcus sp. 1139]
MTDTHQTNQPNDGVAVAGSFASTPTSTSAPVTAESTPVRDGTDAANPGSTPAPDQPARTRTRDLSSIADRLSERDWAVLRSVAAHRFLTSAQITRLHFAGHADTSGPVLARRTLGRLRSRRLLASLERRIGGVRAGSSGLVYHVDVVGDRLLRRESGRTSRRRFSSPSPTFLRHTLAVAQTHILLLEASRAGQCELVRCEIEPASWRRHLGLGGARLTLKPDLFAETATDHDSAFTTSWFIEVDLGTEHQPTLLRKCHDYDVYYRSGAEQAEHGVFPLVVWIMTASSPEATERRCTALRQVIDKDQHLDSALFHVITPDQLIPLIKNGGTR